MRRALMAVFAALLLATLLTNSKLASADCQFALGFKAIHDQIPDKVGKCLANEHYNPATGDALQETTAWHGKGGLLVWHKADNWTAFTDGWITWVNGPNGLQQRSNDQRFAWESDAAGHPIVQTPLRSTVFIDPGHGGIDTGAVGITEDGNIVYEKDVALALALRTADHLRADGINVILSRTDDTLPGATRPDFSSDGTMLSPEGLLTDLQQRIDLANASGAQVLLSIHFNGFYNPWLAGTATIYCGSRSFADKSWHFATLIQDTIVGALRAQEYTTPDFGVIDDEDLNSPSLTPLGASYKHLALLGTEVSGLLRPCNVPGAIVETLFLTNPPEATAAVQPDTQELFAFALASAIEQYLQD